jgi:BirA family transcriptional regulator, biotin operon repressor / biotin---[acetyl-CoA-carboxylase] ligase
MSKLAADRISELLTTERLGRSLELKSETGSTNDDARAAASAGAPDGHVVVADLQTRGRGSRGRSWSSPAGTDLYVSVVVRLNIPPLELPPLTLAVGLAAALALEPFLDSSASSSSGALRPLVKWPNDVWVGRKKLVGVLVECSSIGERIEPLVIGVGINVNRTTFPDDLALPATSLALLRAQPTDRNAVLAALLNQLESWLDRFVSEGPAPLAAAVSARLALAGELATCADLRGVVEGVASTGALLLRTDRGLQALSSGTLRPCEEPSEAPA